MSTRYAYSSRHLSSRYIDIDYLDTAGPRIVGLNYKGSPNLFAELPDISIPTPFGDFHYIGGHRLWHAPESMPESYIPDNDGLTFSEVPECLMLTGKKEAITGIQKQIKVQLDPNSARIVLTHTLINENQFEVEIAPWAITMFRLGGTAIFPIQVESPDSNGLLPDRNISLWPYSHINDSRLHLEDSYLLVKGRPNFPPFKIGAFNSRGWVAYWLEGILFKKSFAFSTEITYPDNNCNAEIYTDSDFIELESLGQLAKITPGASIQLTETWELFDDLCQDFIPTRISEFILKLKD